MLQPQHYLVYEAFGVSNMYKRLTVKLAEGHVELVDVEPAVSVGVVVADEVAERAALAQLLEVLALPDLLELLALEVAVVVLVVVREHYAHQVLLALVVLGHQSRVVVQQQVVLLVQ